MLTLNKHVYKFKKAGLQKKIKDDVAQLITIQNQNYTVLNNQESARVIILTHSI